MLILLFQGINSILSTNDYNSLYDIKAISIKNSNWMKFIPSSKELIRYLFIAGCHVKGDIENLSRSMIIGLKFIYFRICSKIKASIYQNILAGNTVNSLMSPVKQITNSIKPDLYLCFTGPAVEEDLQLILSNNNIKFT